MAELADAHGSGPCAARLVGSTPTVGTKFAGMAYRLCTSLPSWLEGFDPPYPLHSLVGFPSGQRGQTVNLLARLSMVRIHLPPPFTKSKAVAKATAFLFCKNTAARLCFILLCPCRAAGAQDTKCFIFCVIAKCFMRRSRASSSNHRTKTHQRQKSAYLPRSEKKSNRKMLHAAQPRFIIQPQKFDR